MPRAGRGTGGGMCDELRRHPTSGLTRHRRVREGERLKVFFMIDRIGTWLRRPPTRRRTLADTRAAREFVRIRRQDP